MANKLTIIIQEDGSVDLQYLGGYWADILHHDNYEEVSRILTRTTYEGGTGIFDHGCVTFFRGRNQVSVDLGISVVFSELNAQRFATELSQRIALVDKAFQQDSNTDTYTVTI